MVYLRRRSGAEKERVGMHTLLDNYDNSGFYRWVIVLAGVLGLFAALGLGRFSLGMMLPAMAEGVGMSYSQMGVVSTLNFCGYLAAVLVCGRLNRLLGARVLIFLALLLVGVSMALISCLDSYIGIVLLYCCTGVGTALANVPIMALISTWFEPGMRGRAAGICVMGNGLGLVFSGQLVPLLNEMAFGWRSSWLVLGGVVVVIAVVALLLIRNSPAEKRSTWLDSAKNSRKHQNYRVERAASGQPLHRKKAILHCGLLYFLFGFTYVIYVTFMVTFLVEERGYSEYGAGQLWALAGLFSLGSGPLFGYFSDRYGRKSALMVVFGLQACAYLLVGFSLPPVAIYASLVCYAIVAWSVPSIMAALVGDYVGAEGAAAAFGFVTFIFGIGQIAGPALAGGLAEKWGSFQPAFLAAAFCVALAGAFSAGLPGSSTGKEKG